MELKKFITLRDACFLCNAPIKFRVTERSIAMSPKHLNASFIGSSNILQLSYKDITITANLKHNNYSIFPNEKRSLRINIEGLCLENTNHYSFESENIWLNYVGKAWTILPDFKVSEFIQINVGEIKSIFNCFDENKTVMFLKNNTITIPLVKISNENIPALYEKLKMYMCFL